VEVDVILRSYLKRVVLCLYEHRVLTFEQTCRVFRHIDLKEA
jgi:hypothetical protein